MKTGAPEKDTFPAPLMEPVMLLLYVFVDFCYPVYLHPKTFVLSTSGRKDFNFIIRQTQLCATCPCCCRALCARYQTNNGKYAYINIRNEGKILTKHSQDVSLCKCVLYWIRINFMHSFIHSFIYFRNVGLGVNNAMARFGAMIAPQLVFAVSIITKRQ